MLAAMRVPVGTIPARWAHHNSRKLLSVTLSTGLPAYSRIMQRHPGIQPAPGGARRRSYLLLCGCAAAVILVVTVVIVSFWMTGKPPGALATTDLLANLKDLRTHALAPLVTVPLFLAGALLLAPLYGMIGMCALLFDPLTASLAALGGTMIATAMTHWMGAHFGRAFGHRLPERVSTRVNAAARRACVWSIAGLQCMPIGPFAVVNMFVGALGVPLRTFLAGTFIAMVPTSALICVGVSRAQAVLEGGAVFEPWALVATAASGSALLALAVWRRQYASRSESRE